MRVDVERKHHQVLEEPAKREPFRASKHQRNELNELLIDRCRQLVDIANGVNYLHGVGVIHGDLKGVTDLHLSVLQNP